MDDDGVENLIICQSNGSTKVMHFLFSLLKQTSVIFELVVTQAEERFPHMKFLSSRVILESLHVVFNIRRLRSHIISSKTV